MGALPKKKPGKSRTRRRRSQWLKLSAPNLVPCPTCGALKPPHQVCPDCGTYRGRVVLEVEE